MVSYIQPFNFQAIFINLFFGTIDFWIFGFAVVYSFAAAKLGFSNRIYLTLLGLGLLIFASMTQFGMGKAVYLLVLIMIGFSVYKGISRIIGGG